MVNLNIKKITNIIYLVNYHANILLIYMTKN